MLSRREAPASTKGGEGRREAGARGTITNLTTKCRRLLKQQLKQGSARSRKGLCQFFALWPLLSLAAYFLVFGLLLS